jgi:bacterioferritin-associated ferredoxin
MIVCMCNRVTDGKIKAAIAAGAKTPAEVFKLLRVQRACGQCLEAIAAQIAEARAAASA